MRYTPLVLKACGHSLQACGRTEECTLRCEVSVPLVLNALGQVGHLKFLSFEWLVEWARRADFVLHTFEHTSQEYVGGTSATVVVIVEGTGGVTSSMMRSIASFLAGSQ